MSTHPIPDEAHDDRLAFVGTSGSGKTYAAGTAVEQLLESGARVVVVDPLDVWWGLRLKADGSPSRHNVIILGGAHGDLDLNEDAGGAIGAAVATSSQSVIVSLGGLPSKAAERRFMRAFLEAIYQHATGEPFHLIFDEADLWAPQRATGETAMLLGRMEEIIRRGRVNGFIPWLITQRPAVIAKDVLSQMDGMVAMKLTGAHDRRAIEDWIGASVDTVERAKIIEPLARFQRGEGILWLPARGILEQVKFPAKATYDSSRTPSRGEPRRNVRLQPIDIEGLRSAIAPKPKEAVPGPATSVLPKGASSDKPVPDPAAIEAAERRGYERGMADGSEKIMRAVAGLATDLADSIGRAEDACANAKRLLASFSGFVGTQADEVEAWRARGAAIEQDQQPSRKAPPPAAASPAPAPAASLTPPLQRVLDAIAWWRKIGFDPVRRERAAVVGGYSPKASTFGVYLADLTKRRLVHAPAPGTIALTAEGLKLARTPKAASEDDLRTMALTMLKPQEQRVFEVIYRAWPKAIRRAAVAEALGLSPSASTAGVYIAAVASFGIIEPSGPGEVRAADWLFPKKQRQ